MTQNYMRPNRPVQSAISGSLITMPRKPNWFSVQVLRLLLPNLLAGRFKWIHVDHPSKHDGEESSPGGLAALLRGDGACQAEFFQIDFAILARGGMQRFVCRCHCATLSGTRSFN